MGNLSGVFLNQAFSDYIEARRKAMKLSKSALAKHAGLSRQGLYKIINGDVEQTYLSTLVKLARPLGVHPIVLIQKLFDRWAFSSLETEGAMRRNDATAFVGDLTYPDNSMVLVGQRFTKVWRSQNVGKKVWEGCALKCIDNPWIEPQHTERPVQRGLMPERTVVEIPTTAPGETVDIEVVFTAPSFPCSVISYWKMVDSAGNLCFPDREGLTCMVQVVDL